MDYTKNNTTLTPAGDVAMLPHDLRLINGTDWVYCFSLFHFCNKIQYHAKPTGTKTRPTSHSNVIKPAFWLICDGLQIFLSEI